MNERLLDIWARGLPPDDVARALAALMATRNVWSDADEIWVQNALRHTIEETSDSLIVLHGHLPPFSFRLDGRSWARGWQRFIDERTPPRLELLDTPLGPAETLNALARPIVGAESIYLRRDQPEGEVRWEWPLRVGFLNNGESVALHEALARLMQEGKTQWRQDYIALSRPGNTGGRGCHLLLLPWGLRGAVAALALERRVVRTACTLVLGADEGVPEPSTLLSAVRVQSRAAGAVLINVPAAQLVSPFGRYFEGRPTVTTADLWAAWFIDLVRELSHNHPLDVALFHVWRTLGGVVPPPMLLASRRMITESRLSTRLARLAEEFQSPDVAALKLRVGPETAIRLRVPEAELPLSKFGAKLEPHAHDLSFFHESDAGTAMLDLLRAFRQVRAVQLPRTPRWVQAYVYALAKEKGLRQSKPERRQVATFEQSADHEVDVFIGPREVGAIQPPSDAPPLREDDLPDDHGVTLTVVFAPSDADATPQVQQVFLPRNGRSTACTFFLSIPEQGNAAQTQVEARIIVLYRNRVLQTSILRGRVRGGNEVSGQRITITPEVIVHDDFRSLETRSDFDATLILNHAGDGTQTITAVRDASAIKIRLSETIKQAADWFDTRMEEVADNAKSFGKLNSKSNVKLLREMAQQGASLRASFDELAPGNIDLSVYDRLQIVSADPNTRLPVEFFYDRKAPHEDAKLCDGAAEALASGNPCRLCAVRAADDNSVVCPVAFWGLSKVLERHLHRKGDELPVSDELRVAAPADGRDILYVLGPHLFAASNRVDAEKHGGIERLRKALRKACKCDTPDVTNWRDWSNQVKQQALHLLFLIPHVIDDQATVIEIGAGSKLKTALVDATHVRSPSDRDPPPVVVLLGCRTGKAKYMFSNVVAAFRQQRPAVVLCTGAPIVGRHAVPVAEALLEALQAAAGAPEPRSLGDVMRSVRRAMVLRGLPMVMTVIAYGDLDWRIGGPPESAKAKAAAPPPVGTPARRQKELLLVTP